MHAEVHVTSPLITSEAVSSVGVPCCCCLIMVPIYSYIGKTGATKLITSYYASFLCSEQSKPERIEKVAWCKRQLDLRVMVGRPGDLKPTLGLISCLDKLPSFSGAHISHI